MVGQTPKVAVIATVIITIVTSSEKI